jgi:hypothetical protein
MREQQQQQQQHGSDATGRASACSDHGDSDGGSGIDQWSTSSSGDECDEELSEIIGWLAAGGSSSGAPGSQAGQGLLTETPSLQLLGMAAGHAGGLGLLQELPSLCWELLA